MGLCDGQKGPALAITVPIRERYTSTLSEEKDIVEWPQTDFSLGPRMLWGPENTYM